MADVKPEEVKRVLVSCLDANDNVVFSDALSKELKQTIGRLNRGFTTEFVLPVDEAVVENIKQLNNKLKNMHFLEAMYFLINTLEFEPHNIDYNTVDGVFIKWDNTVDTGISCQGPDKTMLNELIIKFCYDGIICFSKTVNGVYAHLIHSTPNSKKQPMTVCTKS